MSSSYSGMVVPPLKKKEKKVSHSVISDSCEPVDSVHGILQVNILEWIAMPSSRGSSQPRDQTQVSHTAGGFFTVRATREALPTAYQGEVEKSLRAYWNISESLCLGSKQTRGSSRWY